MGRRSRAERFFHDTMDQMHDAFRVPGVDVIAKATAFRRVFEANFARIDHRKLDPYDNSQLRQYMYELSKQLVEHGLMFVVPGDFYDDFRFFELEVIHFPKIVEREFRLVDHETLPRMVERSFFTADFSCPISPTIVNPFNEVIQHPVSITKRNGSFVIAEQVTRPLPVADRYAPTVDMGFEYLSVLHLGESLLDTDEDEEFY